MKLSNRSFVLSLIGFALGALKFADADMHAGGNVQGTSQTYEGYTGADPKRAASLFRSIQDWTPGQFKNGVELSEVKTVRDPEGNTLLHRAIQDGNLSVAELIVREYGGLVTEKNKAGVTAGELAITKGPEFAGIFGDMPTTK